MAANDRDMAANDRDMAAIDRDMAAIDRDMAHTHEMFKICPDLKFQSWFWQILETCKAFARRIS